MSDTLTQPKFYAPGQPERRSFGRRTMFRHAEAVVPGGPRFPCIVIDKSDAGALLKVKPGVELPDSFKLILEDDNQVLQCNVIRREPEHVGVEFVRAAKVDIKIVPSMLRSSVLLKKTT
jgi:PilZ domain